MPQIPTILNEMQQFFMKKKKTLLSLLFAFGQFPEPWNGCGWQCCLVLSLFSKEMICWLAYSDLLEVWNLGFKTSSFLLFGFSVFQQLWSFASVDSSAISDDAFRRRVKTQRHHARPVSQEVAGHHSAYTDCLGSSGETWWAKGAQ